MISIPVDKANHFILGQIVSLATLIILGCPVIALIATAVVAIGKEIYDAMGYGTPEVADVTYTLAGGLVPIFVVLFF